MMLATVYLFHLLRWQGDHYGIWYAAAGKQGPQPQADA